MSTELIGIKAGRSWSIGRDGRMDSLRRVYLVRRNGAVPTKEETAFANVPSVGDAHPDYAGLFVSKVSVAEGENPEQNILRITVDYSADDSALDALNRPPKGQAVQAWGWRSGSVQRDLVINKLDGEPILNSARQPFDSAPVYDVATPTFNKVVKTMTFQSWTQFVNKINAAAVTIGTETFGAYTVRCVGVDVEKLWNDDAGFQYQYSISCQICNNVVSIAGAAATNIGWDLAVTDSGCYERENGSLKRISVPDSETGKAVLATTPQLLNGQGGRLTGNEPFNIRVRAYDTATFPSEFFSEA